MSKYYRNNQFNILHIESSQNYRKVLYIKVLYIVFWIGAGLGILDVAEFISHCSGIHNTGEISSLRPGNLCVFLACARNTHKLPHN